MTAAFLLVAATAPTTPTSVTAERAHKATTGRLVDVDGSVIQLLHGVIESEPSTTDQGGAALQTGEDNTVEFEYVEFGRYNILGDFGATFPGRDDELITVDEAAGRLAAIRLDTGTVIHGDTIEAEVSEFFVTDAGNDIYAFGTRRQGQDSVVEAYLVDVDDLAVEAQFSSVAEEGSLSTPLWSTVPGTDQFVLSHRGEILLVETALSFPDIEAANEPLSMRIYPGGHGYYHDRYSEGTYAFDVAPTGISNHREIFSPFGDQATRGFVDDGIVRGNTIYSIPDLNPSPFTPTEQAEVVHDPTLELSYRTANGRLAILDAAGEVLTTGVCSALPPGTLVGSGRVALGAQRNGSISISNVIERCGAYGDFTAVQPARVFDTRSGHGRDGNTEPISGGSTTRVQIHGFGGVPATGVESVVLNVTAIRQRDSKAGRNYLTVWPAGFTQPTVASVNLADGQIVGNTVTVSTSADGFVDLYSNTGTVDVTVDVMGYFRSALTMPASRFEPTTRRLVDTRRTGPLLGPGNTFGIDTDVPRGVTAVALNVTAVGPDLGGHFRIHPSGSPLPDASSMNFPSGANTNRMVIVPVSSDGGVELWNAVGTTHVTVDLVGMFRPLERQFIDGEPNQQGRFIGLVPFRLFDTRESSPFDDGGVVPSDFFLTQGGYEPGTVIAGSVAAVNATSPGYLSLGEWRDALPRPGDHLVETSSLNYAAGAVIGNQTLIPTGEAGVIGVYVSGTTHVVLDVFGSYTASSG